MITFYINGQHLSNDLHDDQEFIDILNFVKIIYY